MIGIDVGGTFTDFIFVDAKGRVTARKRPSSPEDPSRSILEGLQEARSEGLMESGDSLIHGTTVATNALLERRGARTALITTQGFGDVLEIGRQARENLYSFHPRRTEPLLSREHRHELSERVDWRGQVLTPLDRKSAETLLDRLAEQGVESAAVCFLFSYLYPAHEQEVGEIARSRGLAVSLSCEIAPEPREFERTSTTVANAFVLPVMARYLERLAEQLQGAGAGVLRIMQSNGGALSAQEASAQAIKTALSGPAGGVIAAAQIGGEAGFDRLLTFDMGGTSTDVALIQDGQCPVVTTALLGGLPLRTPMLDIHTVGAGGGSLARIDGAGGLRVGPQSAGADPGPIAYGKGEILTVTDANVLLGRLPAQALLGGAMPLDGERVRAYFADFAACLRCSPEQAAAGILQVANAAMSRALRHISVERGHDPADFTLLSFGGAGGLHACALAESLGMRQTLIPRYPGAFSALGLALAETRREYVRAMPALRITESSAAIVWDRLFPLFDLLEAKAQRDMEAEGFPDGRWLGENLLDMRYIGQSFELRIPLVGQHIRAAIGAFHAAHLARYGHSDAREAVEITAVRRVAVGKNACPRLHPDLPSKPGEPLGETLLHGESGWESARIYARESLAEGQQIIGPALVLQPDATTYLVSGWQARTDAGGNLVLMQD